MTGLIAIVAIGLLVAALISMGAFSNDTREGK